MATLDMNFRIPVWRELIMALGFCAVSKSACDAVLQQRRKRRTLGNRCPSCHQTITRIGRIVQSHLSSSVSSSVSSPAQHQNDFDRDTKEATTDTAVHLYSTDDQLLLLRQRRTAASTTNVTTLSDTNQPTKDDPQAPLQAQSRPIGAAATTATTTTTTTTTTPPRACLCRSPMSLLIVVGGAQEALDAHPRTLDLVLDKRKGFFRLAYQHGVALVPVLSFGENDLFQQLANPQGSWLRRVQTHLLRVFGFAMPLFWGRAGILPRRTPIHTVVGRPIYPTVGGDGGVGGVTGASVVVVADPTDEMIASLRAEYLRELQRIFDKYKDQFAADRRKSLTIVG